MYLRASIPFLEFLRRRAVGAQLVDSRTRRRECERRKRLGEQPAQIGARGRKILCELKRDYHAEVWTAIEGQLDRFYLHDPEANGFGVYCVFWFGKNRKRPMPNPPKGLSPPASAAEMEKTLRGLMPENMRSRVAVIIIDVSGEY
jgi:hypothetical protein